MKGLNIIYLRTLHLKIKIMKKYILPFALSGLMLLSACGPSAEEKAAEQKRIQDSIAEAQRLAEEALQAEKQRVQDSINAVVEQMRQDSIKMAEELAAAKKGAVKPKAKVTPKEEPKGTGITKGGNEIKTDGKPASNELPKVTKGGQPVGGGK